jgi:hypothetical protein
MYYLYTHVHFLKWTKAWLHYDNDITFQWLPTGESTKDAGFGRLGYKIF